MFLQMYLKPTCWAKEVFSKWKSIILQKKNPLLLTKSNEYFSHKREVHADLGKRKKKNTGWQSSALKLLVAIGSAVISMETSLLLGLACRKGSLEPYKVG